MIKERITKRDVDEYKREVLKESVLVPIPEAARILSHSESHVRQLIREGTLPAYSRHGIKQRSKGIRILAADLKSYVKSIKVNPSDWSR